jgi:hypothetical protein
MMQTGFKAANNPMKYSKTDAKNTSTDAKIMVSQRKACRGQWI